MDRISVESVLSQIRAMQEIAAGGQKAPATETPGKADFSRSRQVAHSPPMRPRVRAMRAPRSV